MKRNLYIISAAMLLIATTLIVWTMAGHRTARETGRAARDPVCYTVKRGKLRATLIESGTFKAKRSETYTFEDATGVVEIKIAWLADENSMVHAGEKIAEFDRSSIEKSIEDVQRQLGRSREKLVQIEADETLWRIGTKKKRLELESQKRLAELALKNLKEGEGKMRIARARAARDKASGTLARAEQKLKDLQSLHAEHFVTDDEVRQQELAVDEARDALTLAESELTVLEKFTLPMKIAQAEVDVNQRVKELERQRMTVAEEATKWTAQKQGIQDTIDDLTRRRDKLQKALDACVVTARVTGLVIHPKGWFGGQRRKAKVGDRLWGGQVFLEQPDLGQWTIKTQIREVDWSRIRGRNPAILIRPTAFPDMQLKGKIVAFGGQSGAVSITGDQAPIVSKAFSLIIDVIPPDGKTTLDMFRPDMTATVTIITDDLNDVLLVPEDAIHMDGDTSYVLVVTDDNPAGERRDIVRGATDGDVVVARKGLSENERVILRAGTAFSEE